jgi:hypothetical protein
MKLTKFGNAFTESEALTIINLVSADFVCTQIYKNIDYRGSNQLDLLPVGKKK